MEAASGLAAIEYGTDWYLPVDRLYDIGQAGASERAAQLDELHALIKELAGGTGAVLDPRDTYAHKLAGSSAYGVNLPFGAGVAERVDESPLLDIVPRLRQWSSVGDGYYFVA